MNNPHSLPENSTPNAEGGLLFDDWNTLEEKNSTENTASFDGKIIARMPDLGSENIVKNIRNPKNSPFWEKIRPFSSFFQQKTPEARQQLFRRITTVGGIILLCGIGIILFDSDKDGATENVTDRAEILSELTGLTDSTDEPVVFVSEAAFSPITSSTGNLSSALDNAMPNVVSYTPTPIASPPSPWDRPAADTRTSWENAPAQPENPFLPIDSAAVYTTSTMPSEPLVMSPMYPIGGTSMPVSPHEMPISPFEAQLVAQANTPNYPAIPPGMMPMQERRENVSGVMPQQFSPPMSGHTVPMPHQSGQFGQQPPQYVVPPGYLLPQQQAVPQQSIPIPSGVSTLNQQGGQPLQNMQSQVPRPPNDFYYAPPHNYQRLY